MAYEIILQEDFDEFEWEVKLKGWIDVKICVNLVTFLISFYDPVRLFQEIADSVSQNGLFFERNVIVIPEVTRQNIEKAVKTLYVAGKFQV